MLTGFKDFVLRGNVVDLAVAVAIGFAFVTLIGAFNSNIIEPIVAAFGPGDSQGLGFQIRDLNPNTFVDIGSLITAIITFVITAAVIYFLVVVPMKQVRERLMHEPAPAAAAPEIALLTEIRDLLREQQAGGRSDPPTTRLS